MRTMGVMVLAIGFAVLTAWSATKWEFRQGEQPLAAVVGGQARSDQTPQVVVEGEETYHFGTMDVAATGSHTFVIKNVGSAPLALHKGHTSCKCTLSELDQGVVPPGSSTEVRLEWHPPSATPEFEQSAEIATNDPQRPLIQLKIRGRVLEALAFESANLVVGDVSVNESHTFETKLWSYREQPLELKKWEFLESNVSKYFTLRTEPISSDDLKKQPDAKGGYKLWIDLQAGVPLGALTQKVKLYHNYEGIEPLELTISGKSVGDITIISPKYVADKDYLEFGNIVRARGYQTKVYLLVKGPRRDTMQFSVQNVDPAEILHVKIGEPSRPSDKSVLWPIEIEIPAGAETVSRIGSEIERLARITLTTNDSVTSQVVLRVRVAVVEE